MRVALTISGLGRILGGDLDRVLELARAADAAGIHQLVLPDHVAIGPRLDRYPFADRFPYPPEEPWLEPMTTLAAIAGVTDRVRLATGVLIGPARPAVLLAKTAATLDVLSRGRLDLGLGTGWQREELAAVGVPYREREARLDDTARACRALWNDDPPVGFASATVSFDALWCEPRPVQPGGVPLWFGGGPTEATARRIAELGVGWLPVGGTSADDVGRGIGMLREAFERAGRDPATLEVRASGEPDLLEELGVTVRSTALGRAVATFDDALGYVATLAR